MKLGLLLLFLPCVAFAQKEKTPTEDEVKTAYKTLPKVEGQYEWTEVVQVDSSFKKDDLYRNAKVFFANEFKSAKDVLQYDDRAEGKVIGKGNFHLEDGQIVFVVYYGEKRDINFTLEIFSKDGKYRYRIYNINTDYILRASGGSGPDNIMRGTLTLDESFQKTDKGAYKKACRRLFLNTIGEIHSTIEDIKKGMINPRKDDF